VRGIIIIIFGTSPLGAARARSFNTSPHMDTVRPRGFGDFATDRARDVYDVYPIYHFLRPLVSQILYKRWSRRSPVSFRFGLLFKRRFLSCAARENSRCSRSRVSGSVVDAVGLLLLFYFFVSRRTYVLGVMSSLVVAVVLRMFAVERKLVEKSNCFIRFLFVEHTRERAMRCAFVIFKNTPSPWNERFFSETTNLLLLKLISVR